MNQENKTITPDALTAILHKRADNKLELKIQSLANPLYRHSKWIALSDHCLQMLTPDTGGKVAISNLVTVLRNCLIINDTEAARAAEVAEFLAKVENTAAELDAIREEINQ
jgi:hypothetical protein